MKPLAIALVHAPVLDRRGDVVASAVTNLDIHDIARAARTYGVSRYYLVTPAAEQQKLVSSILAHWRQGHGASYNPARGAALALVDVQPTLDAALEDWTMRCAEPVRPYLTSARSGELDYPSARAQLALEPGLIIFGTGHGLHPMLFERGWPVLAPIAGGADYNHLSVRSAVAIILDRLLG